MIAEAISFFLFPVLSWTPALICWIVFECCLVWRNRKERIKWLYVILALLFLTLLILSVVYR